MNNQSDFDIELFLKEVCNKLWMHQLLQLNDAVLLKNRNIIPDNNTNYMFNCGMISAYESVLKMIIESSPELFNKMRQLKLK